jgi:archaellum component FlaC
MAIQGRTIERIVYITTIVGLLGVVGMMFTSAKTTENERLETEHKLSQMDSLNLVLDMKYNNIVDELTRQKGVSSVQDAYIDSVLADLADRKNDINGLLKSKDLINMKAGEAEQLLKAASAKINALEADRVDYMAQIEEMTLAYEKLANDFEIMYDNYEGEMRKNKKLASERDSVAFLGSAIMAKNIALSGLKSKGEGKEKQATKAKSANKMKVCFDLAKNPLSAGKSQTFYVKLIDPNGVTVQSAESMYKSIPGTIGSKKGYTSSITVDYKGDNTDSYCVYWEQNYEFIEGTYTAEVYHNGQMVGNNTFEFK